MKVSFRAFHGPTDWGWVQRYIPIKRVEDTGGIMAINAEKNETVAACIMDSWSATAVQVHLVITNSMVLRHGYFEEIADYVYNFAGRNLMVGMVPEHNTEALKLDKHIGFVETGRIPGAVQDDEDLVILTMTKEQCRFWSPRQAAVNE